MFGNFEVNQGAAQLLQNFVTYSNSKRTKARKQTLLSHCTFSRFSHSGPRGIGYQPLHSGRPSGNNGSPLTSQNARYLHMSKHQAAKITTIKYVVTSTLAAIDGNHETNSMSAPSDSRPSDKTLPQKSCFGSVIVVMQRSGVACCGVQTVCWKCAERCASHPSR